MLKFADGAIPADLALTPVSRWPTLLSDDSIEAASALDIAALAPPSSELMTPAVSIVLASHDNRVYLTLCLRSVLAHSGADCEVIVIDNGSTDGTTAEVHRAAAADRRIRVIANADNRSFAAAMNQGIAMARGARVVLLNDDTIVPPGWLPRLLAHLDNDAIGIVGVVTNRAGNEAQLDTSYRTYAEMVAFADDVAASRRGSCFDIRTATMFCVAMPTALWREIGPLDEQFEVGMFEDEDYAMRARAAGRRVVCAEDAFVHHFGQASIGKLAASEEYGRLFHANRRRWESKWQCEWEPYRKRTTDSYDRMLREVRDLVDRYVPAGATVVVASKGDDALLSLGGRPAWHFPQAAGGGYAGFHPADSETAIQHLEELRRRGPRFFVLPSHVAWWLDHYAAFRQHLETWYSLVTSDPGAGVIYQLEAPR